MHVLLLSESERDIKLDITNEFHSHHYYHRVGAVHGSPNSHDAVDLFDYETRASRQRRIPCLDYHTTMILEIKWRYRPIT